MLEKTQLKRWWFILPLPVTMILAGVFFALRSGSYTGLKSIQDAFGLFMFITLFGGRLFPVGLPLCLTFGNPEPLRNAVLPIVLLGYLLYIGLSIYGARQRSRIVLMVLCFLLLLNLIGCQFNGAVGLLPIDEHSGATNIEHSSDLP